MQSKLRRYKDTLIVTGNGVILFGIWTVIRIVLMFILGSSEIQDIVTEMSAAGDPAIIFYLFLAVILLIALGFHLFIGLGARSEGYGRKKRYAYIVVAFLWALLYIISIVYNLFAFFTAADGPDYTMIISTIIDLTVLSVLIQMIISSIRVKQLTKILALEEAQCS